MLASRLYSRVSNSRCFGRVSVAWVRVVDGALRRGWQGAVTGLLALGSSHYICCHPCPSWTTLSTVPRGRLLLRDAYWILEDKVTIYP